MQEEASGRIERKTTHLKYHRYQKLSRFISLSENNLNQHGHDKKNQLRLKLY